MDESMGTLLAGVAVGILVFLLIREILCWYTKVNKIVKLLEEISSKLDDPDVTKRASSSARGADLH